MQDFPKIDAGQRGKTMVESIGDATVVFQISQQQGQCRFRISAFFRLFCIAVCLFLDGGHGAEHPVVVFLLCHTAIGQDSFQAVIQFLGYFDGNATATSRHQALKNISLQTSAPVFDVSPKFLRIACHICCALCIGKALAIARQLLAADISKHGKHVVL